MMEQIPLQLIRRSIETRSIARLKDRIHVKAVLIIGLRWARARAIVNLNTPPTATRANRKGEVCGEPKPSVSGPVTIGGGELTRTYTAIRAAPNHGVTFESNVL